MFDTPECDESDDNDAVDLARSYIKLGDRDKARTVALEALRASPGDDRLRRIAEPIPAKSHGDQWRAAVTQALDGTTSGLRCPAYDDDELVWEQLPATGPGNERHRLYCPKCGSEVVVDVDSS